MAPSTPKPPKPALLDTKNAHSILAYGLREATEAERPTRASHHGGPKPTCPAPGQLRVGLWMASTVAHHRLPTEAAAAAEVQQAVQDHLAAPDPAHHEALKRLGTEVRRESEALTLLRRVAGAAATWARGKPDVMDASLRAASTRLVRLVRAQGAIDPQTQQPLDVRALLTALDDAIVLEECRFHIERTLGRPIALLSVISRAGATDGTSKGRAAYFVASLPGGLWGALHKEGRFWKWTEAPPAELLALFPASAHALYDEPAVPESEYALQQ